MRLYPPAWGIGREALEDCEIGGYLVPKGTQFFLVQYLVHRDPRWFENPESFQPERWDGDLIKRLPRCAYFPFGDGPRVCIGNHFAMMEAVLVLATIVQRYRLEVLPGQIARGDAFDHPPSQARASRAAAPTRRLSESHQQRCGKAETVASSPG